MLGTLILGVIAALLFFKLFSVLGKHSGGERRQPNPYESAPPPPVRNEVLSDGPLPAAGLEGNADSLPRSLVEGLAAIRQADPGFVESDFLLGARNAFDLIIQAFAAGDSAALRPLLADEVYQDFLAAIQERHDRGLKLEEMKGLKMQSSIVSYESVDLIDARLEGRTATLTVRFVTRQINMTRKADGTIVEGSDAPEKIIDVWSFVRDTDSPDPNWLVKFCSRHRFA